METIFSKVRKEDIRRDPYPHIVIHNALSQELADKLLLEYPSLEQLGSGKQNLLKDGKVPNNIKIRYHSADVFKDTKISPLWREFVRAHTTSDFFANFLELFGEDLYRLYPQMREPLSSLGSDKVGTRGIDTYETKDVLLDAEICADSPVTKTSSVRSAHIDHEKKLGVALLYLRHPNNDSVGGDFEIYRAKDRNITINHIRAVKGDPLKHLDIVTRVPYKHNTLVLFINSPSSFHGVTPRQPTNHLRYVFDIAFEYRHPIFDLEPYRESVLVSKPRAWFRKLTGRHKEMI